MAEWMAMWMQDDGCTWCGVGWGCHSGRGGAVGYGEGIASGGGGHDAAGYGILNVMTADDEMCIGGDPEGRWDRDATGYGYGYGDGGGSPWASGGTDV